ncbi:MAG: thiamine-monophosphate kinase [Opitutales bacterium]|nr:thiamine-monophosphate kinase [Opitutales bacterium]
MKPFSQSDNAASLGEKRLIARVLENFGSCADVPPPFGAGDDCAVLEPARAGENVCVTSDAVILGRHFSEDDPPFAAGEKLVKRNVSDIAAMGARPFAALASSICSPSVSLAWLDEFCKGVGAAARKYGIKIIGGDFASVGGDFFSTHLTLLGRTRFAPLTRSGAKEGDILFTTGALGASLESGHHLSFEPRVELGEFFAASGLVDACIDLSDGMGSDLREIIPQGMCAEVFEEKIPLREYGGKRATLKGAFCDGEDYELLAAFSAGADFEKFSRDCAGRFGAKLREIGAIKKAPSREAEGAIMLVSGGVSAPADFGGFDHYRF